MSDGPARQTPSAAAARLSPGRRWVFRLSALALPLVLLALVEAGLRLAGYGYPSGFFLGGRLGGTPVWIDNERFGWLFPAIHRPHAATVRSADGQGDQRVSNICAGGTR